MGVRPGLEGISRLAAATAGQLVLPLLTIFSPEELILLIIVVFEDSPSGRGQSANRKTDLSYLFGE
jgi:hypothetical protein